MNNTQIIKRRRNWLNLTLRNATIVIRPCVLPEEDLLLLFMEKIQEPSLENKKGRERERLT